MFPTFVAADAPPGPARAITPAISATFLIPILIDCLPDARSAMAAAQSTRRAGPMARESSLNVGAMTRGVQAGRRAIPISHPDKVLFPAAGITKLDLARHYERVAEAMLPYVRERPLALQAFPAGIERHGFFMKAVPDYFPDWVQRVTVGKRGGTVTHALANDAATLVYLAGQNVVTLHPWLSRADEPQKPDRLIVDFDPSKATGG